MHPEPQDAPEPQAPLSARAGRLIPSRLKEWSGAAIRYPRLAAAGGPGTEIHEVTVFHELGKALTSSLQLDQVLRTIMEKINEVLRPDTWSLLLMDMEKHELYFQIATGTGATH